MELHNHCTIGLAEPACLEAAELGVAAVQCASGGAADGTSNPPIQRMIANLRALGHTVEIDDEAVATVAQYFTALAEAEGLPTGHPMAFDAAYLQHQLPGGMVGTMRRHLADHGVPHLEGAVIEEMGRVREELGWPIVMTPFAQMLQTQAMLNVTGKERYAVIPDEIIRYAIGRFGRPNVPIAGETLDRDHGQSAHEGAAGRAGDGRARRTSGSGSGPTCPTRNSCCARRCRPIWSTRCRWRGRRRANTILRPWR